MTVPGPGGKVVTPSPSSAGALVSAATVVRWMGSGSARSRSVLDPVAVEEPLEIRLETRSVAVVMRTPGHDSDLALGFLLGEGVIRTAGEVRAVRVHPRSRSGNRLDVFLSGAGSAEGALFSRQILTSASCGLCGVTSIQQIRRRFPAIRDRFVVDAQVLSSLPGVLRQEQAGFGASGGLHAAGLFGVDGRAWCIREDIGRHNAVDKVVGWAMRHRELPLRGAILLVSGRVSFEILQKALASGIGFLAAVGAPSSLAVAFARANGQTLAGFVREDRFNVYSGPRRIRWRSRAGAQGGAKTLAD